MKSRAGFTLLEVMLALFVLVGSITVLSSLQIKSVMRVLLDKEYLNRVFLVKKDFLESFLELPKDNKPIKQDLEEPEVKIVSRAVDIQKKSELSDFIDTIKIVDSEGNWKGETGNLRRLKFIGFALSQVVEDKKVIKDEEVQAKVS